MLPLLVLFTLLLKIIDAQGLVPETVQCPSHEIFRDADGISQQEKEWLRKRHLKTDPALRDFLKYTAKLSDEEIASAVPQNASINIGIAPSGGSFRAMLTGAGEVSALDNRTAGAFEHGLGGLFQATTYFSGLSGTGWLVGSLASYDFPSIDTILEKGYGIWNLEHPFFSLNGVNVVGSLLKWHDIVNEVAAKRQAGYDVTITDFYQRALARQLLPKENNYSINTTFSNFRESGKVSTGDAPLPIMVANGKPADKPITYQDSTVFEMTPFEFGSWDPYANGFVDMKYLGSTIDAGQAVKCVTNYDNTGFLIGITSSIFDMYVDAAVSQTSYLKPISKAIAKLLSPITKRKEHVAIVDANPFRNSMGAYSTNLKNSQKLFLSDGGEDQQKIPLEPLLIPERKVDIVFAYDLGAELKHYWPAGSSLVNTYERQFTDIGKKLAVPYVPGESTMQALNYTHKPVFFGCDGKNLTNLNHMPPVIVYAANTKYSYASNAPTTKLAWSPSEMAGHIKNGFEIATYGNRTEDANFATCVGCAVIKRSQERLGIEPSERCQQCFNQYCWNGELKN